MDLYSSTVTSSTIHIGCYYLLYDLSSIKKKSTFQRHTLLITVLLCLFPCRTCHLFLSPYLLLCYYYWTVPLEVSYLPTPKTLQLLLLLSPYFYFFLYTTPYYSTHQHLKLIMGNRPSLFHLSPFPAVMDQVPKLFATKILPLFSSLQFCP